MNGPLTSAERAALNSSIAFFWASVSLSAGIGGIRSCASAGPAVIDMMPIPIATQMLNARMISSRWSYPIISRVAVSHPVRIALIGFGYWGPNYARVLNDLPGATLSVVCDRSQERLTLVSDRYRAVVTCSNIEDAISRSDVDAVVIATPASTHAALVRMALERGKHVLVEKPMALDVASCESLCQLASTAKRVLMVGYTFLYNAGVRKMKEYMGPEPFGQMYYLHATRTNLGPIRQDVNAVWDLAPHDIAIFNYLLDEQPAWASAVGTRVLRTNRDDIAFATLGYKNDVVGNIHVSWADPNKVREVVAVGSRRRVVFNDLNDVERVRVFERGVSVSE